MAYQQGELKGYEVKAKAFIPFGVKKGNYVGRVVVRETGSFNLTTSLGTVQGLGVKHFIVIQRMDGYSYQHKKERSA